MASEEALKVERVALSTNTEFACYPPDGQQECWATVSLKAPFYEPTARAPVDIVAVIDKSGSMRGDKLELVKTTLQFIVDQLKECDRLSLVTYDTNVFLNFGLRAMDKTNKEMARETIKSLAVGSSTNICGGLVMGMEQIAFCKGERAQVQSVLLLTDGLANAGIIDVEGMLREMKKIQNPPATDDVTQKNFDGTVYTFGFGSNHNSGLLEAISTQGNGVYYYIDSSDKIPESFGDCLGGLLSVVGQNLTVRLEAEGDNTIKAVYSSRGVIWNVPDKSCEIPLGDIQSEEGRDIVLRLSLPPVDAVQQHAVLKVSVSYFNVISSVLDTVETELLASRNDGERGPPNPLVDVQRNRINAATALKSAQELASQGKLAEGGQMLQETILSLKKTATADNKYCMALVEDLQRGQAGMKSSEQYHKHGRKYVHSKMQTHSVQRSNFVDDHDYYESSAKTSFRGLSMLPPAPPKAQSVAIPSKPQIVAIPKKKK